MTEVAPGSWMVRDVTYPGNRGWGAIRQDRGRAIMKTAILIPAL
ncbi:hypothetical protein SBV1_530013 [Verrucomicrobia bacterium]|nr:hypothetical protein SBV1_530013 [Verrucomicrobiota bacterium]